MKFYQTSLALFLSCIVTTSLACSPNDGETFDVLSSLDTIIGSAEVISVTSAPWGGAGACLTIGYSGIESFHGQIPQSFMVETCIDDASPDDALHSDGMEEMGFVDGAMVIVGLVKQQSDQQGFRYATPSCWGPLHLRLDEISEGELSEVIEAIRKMSAQD